MDHEFRIIIQIEQLDEYNEPICTYGPEPRTLFLTNDSDLAMQTIRNMTQTIRDEFTIVEE
jgi:hypothetical protein